MQYHAVKSNRGHEVSLMIFDAHRCLPMDRDSHIIILEKYQFVSGILFETRDKMLTEISKCIFYFSI